MSVTDNWRRITGEIAEMADHPVTVMAVTKHRGEEDIREIIAAGARVLGENRIGDAHDKFGDGELRGAAEGIELHMIGHIQSRKARDVVTLCDVVQSVDREKIARALDRRCEEECRDTLPVLIEVNAGGEEQKFGVPCGDAARLAEVVMELSHLELRGVMSMAPYVDDDTIIRRCFRDTRAVADRLGRRFGPPHGAICSMGMSHDYRIAVEEGSTLVRIGSAFFA